MQESDWIDVKDELPKTEKDCLVYVKSSDPWATCVGKKFYCGVDTFFLKRKAFHSEVLSLGKVLYWQHIKEPKHDAK